MGSSYYARLGFEWDPFVKDRWHEKLFESSEYLDVCKRLDYLKAIKGFGLITGSPGLGKTTALRSWAEGLDKNLYRISYIALSSLSMTEFYRELASQLGLEPSCRKSDNYRNIQEEITRCAKEKKLVPVIIIDEANHVSSEILQDLKMIFNFEMDSEERAIIILAGLPQLKTLLKQSRHESLRQRIMMNCQLEPLSQEEAGCYLKFKIAEAGGSSGVFEPEAVNMITAASRGVPRVIDRICTRCMILAESDNAPCITGKIAEMAVMDTEL